MTYRDLILAAIHEAAIEVVRQHRDAGIVGVDCAKDGALIRLESGSAYVIKLEEEAACPSS